MVSREVRLKKRLFDDRTASRRWNESMTRTEMIPHHGPRALIHGARDEPERMTEGLSRLA
ncbi:MAG: hypothetical protein CMJ33_04540 [Phycisphaerae bacterium]|nr:hypothetical protein [Phycisphaerae bacterium]